MSIEKHKIPDGLIHPNTFLLGYVGSISHGTTLPKESPEDVDDIDIMGISFGPVNHYTRCMPSSLFEPKQIQQGVWDYIPYEICKYFHLLLKQNPNVICLMNLTDNHYIIKNKYGQQIIKNKHLFISKEAYHSFAGYANDQLYKMTHHAHQGYMGAKRKKLVERFGYDVKNAAHLIRLLRMATELLTDGKFHVYRPDREYLKDIKTGRFKLEEIKESSTELFELAREAYVRSPLPPEPDYNGAQKLCTEMVMEYLHG